MRPSFHSTGQMDAKTIRALVRLAALSLFGTTLAWSALGTVAVLGRNSKAPTLIWTDRWRGKGRVTDEAAALARARTKGR
jgi:hypothetical protein